MEIQSASTSRFPVEYSQESFELVKNLIIAALLECCSVDEFNELKRTLLIGCVTKQPHDDLSVFARKDPTARRDPLFIARTLIGPGCNVTKDVPPGARVQVKTSLQVVIAK